MSSRVVLVLFAAFLLVDARPSLPERKIVDDAAAALGGADRIQSIKAIQIDGSGSAPNAGQNRMPDDELPVWKVTEHSRAIDLANGRTRVRQLREAQFQFAGATVQRLSQGLDGDVAYNAAPDGTIGPCRRSGCTGSSSRDAPPPDHGRASGPGSGRQDREPAHRGQRSARRHHHREGRRGHARRRSVHAPAVAGDHDERQRQHGRRGDRDDVLRLRGRQRRETAAPADDDDGQVSAVRSAGLEEHAGWRCRRSGRAREREVGASSHATAGRRHRRASGEGHLVARRLGQPSQRGIRVRRSPRAVRGASQRGAFEGGDRQGEDAERQAAHESHHLAPPFRSFRGAARRRRGRADDRHPSRQRGVLQGSARAPAYDRAGCAADDARSRRPSSGWTIR